MADELVWFTDETREKAIERMAHQIAGCVHLMLYSSRMTVAELKAKIDAFPTQRGDYNRSEMIGHVLAATETHRVTLDLLSDIALACACEWDFRVVRQTPLPAASAPVSADIKTSE